MKIKFKLKCNGQPFDSFLQDCCVLERKKNIFLYSIQCVFVCINNCCSVPAALLVCILSFKQIRPPARHLPMHLSAEQEAALAPWVYETVQRYSEDPETLRDFIVSTIKGAEVDDINAFLKLELLLPRAVSVSAVLPRRPRVGAMAKFLAQSFLVRSDRQSPRRFWGLHKRRLRHLQRSSERF